MALDEEKGWAEEDCHPLVNTSPPQLCPDAVQGESVASYLLMDHCMFTDTLRIFLCLSTAY